MGPQPHYPDGTVSGAPETGKMAKWPCAVRPSPEEDLMKTEIQIVDRESVPVEERAARRKEKLAQRMTAITPA
jgi:hypothetical protein